MEPRVDRFDDPDVLVIGDLMIDEYVWGDVDRISPEAPVQVVSVIREDLTLGGAGNVVNNLLKKDQLGFQYSGLVRQTHAEAIVCRTLIIGFAQDQVGDQGRIEGQQAVFLSW